MILHTPNKLRPPAARCGRNHRHGSRQQSDECEVRFVARAAHQRAADEEKARAAVGPRPSQTPADQKLTAAGEAHADAVREASHFPADRAVRRQHIEGYWRAASPQPFK